MPYHYISGIYEASNIFRKEFLKHVRDKGREIMCVAQHKIEQAEDGTELEEYFVVSRHFEEDNETKPKKKK